jgi:hypothetical protein
MDVLCVSTDGEEIEFNEVVLLDDEEPYAFDHDGGTYWPHENGMWLKGWRAPPIPRQGGSDADRASS